MSMARPSPILVALLVAASGFMEFLDTTAITPALPHMAVTFGVHPIDLDIGLTAYMVMLAAGIPLSGWAAERFGGRTIFGFAILLFTGASVLCGLADGLWEFVAARILQGIGGAMMVPVGRLIVLRVTPKSELMRATALITWPALAAPILGPVVGGFLTSYASWRWIFFLNLPVGLLSFAAVLWLVGNDRPDLPRKLDRMGALLSGVSAIAFVYGASLLGSTSGSLTVSLGLILLGLFGAAATVVHARRHPHPLIGFRALRERSFAATVRGGSLVRLAINAAPFLLPLLFQLGFGRSPVESGSMLIALFVGNLGIKPLTSPIMRRFGFRRVLIVNGAILGLTFLAMAFLARTTPLWLLLPLLLVSGMTRSVEFTALNTLAFADVPPAEITSANTLFNLAQQVTAGLGIALGAILLRLGQILNETGSVTFEFRIAFLGIGLICLAGLVDFIALTPQAGSSVSGHRLRPPTPSR